jgi:GNAT superfamily N-acetyltransferase
MAIDRDPQREGIGSAFLPAAWNFGISIGCFRMEVIRGDGREHDAHRFYTALGAIPDCRRLRNQLTNTHK